MSSGTQNQITGSAVSQVRLLSERMAIRTAGAPLVMGNSVRVLKDARENYPVWLDAIRSATQKIYFESYIIHEDEQGYEFAEALAAKAREGVKVRLIYDWMGGWGSASRKFWQKMRHDGIEVRCFNPPNLLSPFGWMGRDHRKMISVDGCIAFVTGMCVGQMWVGDAERNIDPWRDTGVEVIGPAVIDIERSFAQMWAILGTQIPGSELADPRDIQPAGDVGLRVIASMPNTAGLYRLDQIVAANARETLWLTDAYFAGTTPYVQALRAAALDGVDVRLLVPQATDLPVVRALSRSGYRPLLESGVRVYEWNGSMIHAKTAVSDGKWARVGSTNLNLVSWISNWELDLVIENHRICHEMERMFINDLDNATEIVLSPKRRPAPVKKLEKAKREWRKRFEASSGSSAAAGAIRLGNVVGASITNRRVLGPAEARIMLIGGILLLAVSLLAVWQPRSVTVPLAVLGVWVATSLLIRSVQLYRQGKKEEKAFHKEMGKLKAQEKEEKGDSEQAESQTG
ncbi:MAG: cardiolipin synthase B [Acidobacteria bacterium]|nr:cardiolipin synthase B [Acidobacteriota bacterium]